MKLIKELYKHFLKSDGVSTDSRQVVKNKIFFALSGENFNGNKFAKSALSNGALLCVIDDTSYDEGEGYFMVDDVLETLQQLANYHRRSCSATVMAITGSNGKTTTKELIAAVLGNTIDIISTVGNYNNHIGVPLTLLTIEKSTKIAVVEMGANHIGEIDLLCKIAEPDVGMITNIGKAHLEGFGSYEGVITAKSELYNYILSQNGQLIVNGDDSLLMELSGNSSKTVYARNDAAIQGELTESLPFLHITWGYNQKVHKCNSQLYGSYNFTNVMAAIATGIYFGVDEEIINKSIENYIPSNNRSQQIETKHNRVILDAYNANPYSMKEAVSSFAASRFKNPWLFLGDMFELGTYSSTEHQEIVTQLLSAGFKNVALIGNEFCSTQGHEFHVFKSTIDAIEFLSDNVIEDADILIKGSRGMKMEDLLESL